MNLPTKLLTAVLFTAAIGLVIVGTAIAIPLIAALPAPTSLVIVKPLRPAKHVAYLSPLPLHTSASANMLQPIPLTCNAPVQPIPTQWPTATYTYTITSSTTLQK